MIEEQKENNFEGNKSEHARVYTEEETREGAKFLENCRTWNDLASWTKA
jgi:hypothetical protein